MPKKTKKKFVKIEKKEYDDFMDNLEYALNGIDRCIERMQQGLR
tara:strand:+ start:893 stop:1024 length:132 start_codon:yes stop_codon:yes gene_type:complete